MSRPRTQRRDLPPRMYYKHGAYYHVVRNEWYRLGLGLVDALKGYYGRELDALPKSDKLTFDALRNEYLANGMVDLEPRTRRDYDKQLHRLAAFFSGMALEDIEPHHVVRYHTLRSQTAKVQANREKAVLSLVWNWGRRMGYTKLPNPCQGVRRNKERPREVLVSDSTYRRVWLQADWPTRDALDIARYTAQRPADVLKMRLTDIRGDELVVKQNKTHKIVRVHIEGKLAAVIARIKARRYKIASLALIRNERGEQLSESAFDNRFEKARAAAGVDARDFQFRDLRAKGATRKAEREGDRAAQELLAHGSVKTTEAYLRGRGRKVTPVE